MKKILVSAILGVAALAASAQDYTTVTLKASGTLATVLQENNATNAEYLKVICAQGVYMNQTDFDAIRGNLRNTLKGLDLSETQITYYETRNAFPDSGLQAMYYLETVVLPDNLIAIGQYGFNLCYSLKSINLPNSILYFRPYSFQACGSLQIDKLPDSLREINDNAFYSEAKTLFSNAGFSCTPESSMIGLTASELPAGVTKIGNNAFNGTGVTFSELPEGLTKLGTRAFRNTNVTFSSFPSSLSVDSIGDAAFVNCLGITEFTIPDKMTSIPNQTFYWDKAVTTPRTFYCNQTTPPKAAYDTSGFTGAFGNSNNFSYVTMYVPLEAVSKYESQSPVTPYSTMNITGMLYLVGNMTENDATPDGYGNPSYMFTKSMEEVEGTETPVYTLNVASVSSKDKFYLQSVSQIYSWDMSKDGEGLVEGNDDTYFLTDDNTDEMYLAGSYLNVTFTYIPGSGLFYYTGTPANSDFVITPGNDQTNQSGELNKDDYDIVMTTPYDGVIVFIYVPSDYNQDIAYYEVSSDGIAPAAIQTAKVTDGYFTVPLSVGTAGEISIYKSDDSTEQPAATFTYKVVSGIPTGVETIDEFGSAAEYFTLQGTKVANPAPGNIYIKIANGKVSKILM